MLLAAPERAVRGGEVDRATIAGVAKLGDVWLLWSERLTDLLQLRQDAIRVERTFKSLSFALSPGLQHVRGDRGAVVH